MTSDSQGTGAGAGLAEARRARAAAAKRESLVFIVLVGGDGVAKERRKRATREWATEDGGFAGRMWEEREDGWGARVRASRLYTLPSLFGSLPSTARRAF